MKRLTIVLIVAVLLALVLWVPVSVCAQTSFTKPAPTVVVHPPLVEVNAKSQVIIMGSGFEPAQKLNILLRGADGALINLGWLLSPEPTPEVGIVADQYGNFAYLFTLDKMEQNVSEGINALSVVDSKFQVLATTPVAFADPNGKCRIADYPRGAPDYEKNPDDPRPLPWCEPFFEYPERP